MSLKVWVLIFLWSRISQSKPEYEEECGTSEDAARSPPLRIPFKVPLLHIPVMSRTHTDTERAAIVGAVPWPYRVMLQRAGACGSIRKDLHFPPLGLDVFSREPLCPSELRPEISSVWSVVHLMNGNSLGVKRLVCSAGTVRRQLITRWFLFLHRSSLRLWMKVVGAGLLQWAVKDFFPPRCYNSFNVLACGPALHLAALWDGLCTWTHLTPLPPTHTHTWLV